MENTGSGNPEIRKKSGVKTGLYGRGKRLAFFYKKLPFTVTSFRSKLSITFSVKTAIRLFTEGFPAAGSSKAVTITASGTFSGSFLITESAGEGLLTGAGITTFVSARLLFIIERSKSVYGTAVTTFKIT
jgi:hypothetical protein